MVICLETDSIWLRNSSWGSTHTHTHEMSYEMFQATCATQVKDSLVDAEAVQPEFMHFCTGRIHWSKKRLCPSQCSCKHPSTGDGNSFSSCHLEKLEKIGRKLGENIGKILWNILVLPSFFLQWFGIMNEKVSLECNIFLTCASYAFQICPAFICLISLDTSMFMISACIP